MKIVIFVMIFAQSALCAELLTLNHLFYTSEQSDEFAFESSDKNGILQNPPPNKARIYGVRSKDYLGEKAVYKVFYQYEPKIEPNIKGQNEPIIELNAYENNVFGTFANASKFYKDFDAGKPLLSLLKQKHKRISSLRHAPSAFIACKALSFWAYTRQGQI